MSQYFIKGNRIEVIANGSINIQQELPPNTYFVKYEETPKFVGFYLEQGDNFAPINTVYGDVHERTDLVIETYFDRKKRNLNTGVLLSGLKGTGKTLQAKLIATKLREQYKIPTIIVSESFNSSALSMYLKDISHPCVILFEEFEKMYKSDSNRYESVETREKIRDGQEGLLTLLDGVMNSNKLFIFTCNQTSYVNSLLLNRPGRVWYHFPYYGIDQSIVEDYCGKKLKSNKKAIEQVKQLCDYLDDGFTFDIMQCIVEETIRRKKDPLDIIQYLNIKPEPYNNYYSVKVSSLNPKDSITISNSYDEITIDNYLSEKDNITIRIIFTIKDKEDVSRVNKILQNELDTDECIVNADKIIETDTSNPMGFSEREKTYNTYSVRVKLNKTNLIKSNRDLLVYRKHDLEFFMTKIKKEDYWKTLMKMI